MCRSIKKQLAEMAAKQNKQQFSESGKRFSKFNYDVVLKEMASTGKYQIMLICMAYYTAIPCGMNQLATVFLSAVPEYRCSVPELQTGNLTDDEIRLMSTSLDSNGIYDDCKRFNYVKNCTPDDLSECILNTTSSCTAGYVYDKSMYSSTIVSEWDLVCDRMVFGTISTLIYFLGVCLLSPIGGNLSDRFGRTRVTFFASLVAFVIGMANSFAPSLTVFSAARFVIAGAIITQWEAMFVYLIEIVPNKWRTPIGINVQAVFAIGYILLSGLSHFFRDWRRLQFAMSFFSLVFPVLWIFLPESPRWLLSKGHIEKGKKVSMKISERNGRPLSDEVWDRALVDGEDGGREKQHLPYELFKRPMMRKVTIKIMFIWFNIALVYFGVSLNIGSLVGDDRVNNALGGISELLSCAITILTIDRFGRRPVLCASLIASGISCIASAITSFLSLSVQGLGVAGTVFAMIGKLTVSAAFGIIYNYTAELYPTVVRATAIGAGSMSARIGSIFSTLVVLLRYFVPWLPGTVMGLFAIFAGVVSLFLPETKSQSLTTTLNEAEAFYSLSRNPSKSMKRENDVEEHTAML